LALGWRAEVVGRVVDQLLDGELAIRITEPLSDQPLSFEPAVNNVAAPVENDGSFVETTDVDTSGS